MNKEAWHAMVYRVAKQLDMAEGQSIYIYIYTLNYFTVHVKDCKSTKLQKKKKTGSMIIATKQNTVFCYIQNDT